MFKLLKFLKKYKIETFLGPLLKLAEASLELLVPYVILNIVNNGIEGADKGYIIAQMLLLVGMGFAGLVFSVSAQYFCAKASVGMCARIREKLFEHVQKLGYREIDKLGKSTLITRLTSDMNQVQTGVNLSLRLFLRSPFIVFGALILSFTIDKDAALVFAVAIPLLAIVVFSIMLTTIPLYKKVQTKLDAVLLKTKENLSGVRMLRALCKEDDEVSDFAQKNAELNFSQKKVGKISAIMNPLTYVMINCAIAALVYVGAIKVEYGVLTQGAVIALYNYMSQILIELIKLANLIINLTKGVACGNRVQSIFELSAEENKASTFEGLNDNEVEFSGVSFKYSPVAQNVLSNISFKAGKGETVGIIGGTGSGKTTLINLLCGFYGGYEGSITVSGKNVSTYPREELLSKIGIVPQGSALFAGDIRSNLKFGKEDASDKEMIEALKLSQAYEFVSEKDGLDTKVEQGGKNFSGGQRQRLTIARALIKRPEILILDDSSSALDYATDLKLRRAIRSLDYSPTVFIVSQRASTLRHADKILVLDEGELVGIGTHSTLMESCPVYAEIYDSQSAERRAGQ